jgi:hypothetical protein
MALRMTALNSATRFVEDAGEDAGAADLVDYIVRTWGAAGCAPTLLWRYSSLVTPKAA